MKVNMERWWNYTDGKTELLVGKPAPLAPWPSHISCGLVRCWGKFMSEENLSVTLLVIILSFPIFTFICCQCCVVCIMTGSVNKQQTKRTNLAGCILVSPDIVTLHLQSVQKTLILGFCNVTANSLGDTYWYFVWICCLHCYDRHCSVLKIKVAGTASVRIPSSVNCFNLNS